MIELSRTTQSDLKSIREHISHQLTDVEHRLANSQQRIEDCLVEMNTKTTTNFETTKEESSDSIGVVENKLENLTTKVVDNFLNANNLLKYLINATRQSFKAILLNLRNKLIANQEIIIQKLDSLTKICTNTREFSDDEFLSVKLALNQANKHFDEISQRLNEMMNKIHDLEEKHHFQIQKELEIEFITQDTREKLNEQRNILEQISNIKLPPARTPSPPKVQPKKDTDDLIKRTIRRFDQPTLSQMSKTTKAKISPGQLQPPKETSKKGTISASSSSTSLAGETASGSGTGSTLTAQSGNEKTLTELTVPSTSSGATDSSKKIDSSKKSSTLESKSEDKTK
jgi:hypothetical protein